MTEEVLQKVRVKNTKTKDRDGHNKLNISKSVLC